jgi:hypothetical protein
MAIIASGCLDRELKPLNPCLVSGVSRKVQVKNVDKVDLLFMVDNSNSMAQEQGALRAQFPKLIRTLATGVRPGKDPFPPVKDLHVGIVSSDMGVPGVTGLGTSCDTNGGPDGKMLRVATGPGCAPQPANPPFLAFQLAANDDPDAFAAQVGCIANLGTGGCGFEQQLESPFKALWSDPYILPNGMVKTPNPFTDFLPVGTKPRGNMDPAAGGNLGFLRNTLATGISLIAIVIVTDEEDCSVKTTDHLWPSSHYAKTDKLATEDINLRCYYHPDLSREIERYYNGFRMLRPGNEELVVFAGIVGVPQAITAKESLPNFDDDAARDQWYANLLADPDMQQVPDELTGTGKGNLKVSCRTPVLDAAGQPTGEISFAYPPVRIVKLAQMFGANGIIQSICQADFGPAMDQIIEIIAKQLSEVCLPRKLVRQSKGKVPCNVVWELPLPGTAPADTPVACSQKPYLGQVDEGRATTNSNGGQNCKVNQLAIFNNAIPATEEGWYYDDFSPELEAACKTNPKQRVAFTANARPYTGVTVKLECLNETQKLANTDPKVAPGQPEIGSPCGIDAMGGMLSGGAADATCGVLVTTPTQHIENTMFCHPALNTCVKACISDTDCPPAWSCDTRPNTVMQTSNRPYCVNPTCGAGSTEN